MLDTRRELDETSSVLLDQIADLNKTKVLLINKVDLVDKPRLLEIAKLANARIPFAATFMISALGGDGISDVKAWLANHVVPGPWHYPADQITDAPLRQLAADITREKVYLC